MRYSLPTPQLVDWTGKPIARPKPKPKKKKKPTPAEIAARPSYQKADHLDRIRLTHVRGLTRRHYVNGIAYGPGDVRVRNDIAQVILDQETKANQENDRFYARGLAFVMRGGALKRQVPSATFNDALGVADPISEVNASLYSTQ